MEPMNTQLSKLIMEEFMMCTSDKSTRWKQILLFHLEKHTLSCPTLPPPRKSAIFIDAFLLLTKHVSQQRYSLSHFRS